MIQATWRSSPSSSTLSLRTGMESTTNPSFRVNMEQMQCRGFTVWGFTNILTQLHNQQIHLYWIFLWLIRQLSFPSPGSTHDVYWGVPERSPAEIPRRVWPEEEAVCYWWTHLELCWFHDCTRYYSCRSRQPVEPELPSVLPVYTVHIQYDKINIACPARNTWCWQGDYSVEGQILNVISSTSCLGQLMYLHCFVGIMQPMHPCSLDTS